MPSPSEQRVGQRLARLLEAGLHQRVKLASSLAADAALARRQRLQQQRRPSRPSAADRTPRPARAARASRAACAWITTARALICAGLRGDALGDFGLHHDHQSRGERRARRQQVAQRGRGDVVRQVGHDDERRVEIARRARTCSTSAVDDLTLASLDVGPQRSARCGSISTATTRRALRAPAARSVRPGRGRPPGHRVVGVEVARRCTIAPPRPASSRNDCDSRLRGRKPEGA